MTTAETMVPLVSTPSATEIVLTRVFNAPRHLVFEALTTPALLKRWMGPSDWTLAECEIDLRAGGAWRMVHRGPDGIEMGVSGVYREVSPPERLVSTEVFDEWKDAEALVTTVLVERNGKTTLTTTSRYPNQAARDAVIESGMEGGVSEGYDRLDALLAGQAISDRWRKVSAQFTARVKAVPDGAWDNPAPCEGWVARDVIRHIADWMPSLFLGGAGVVVPELPSVDEDPIGAWVATRDAIQAALDDPDVAGRPIDSAGGRFTVAGAVDQLGSSDIVMHTWDLARATGGDERLDPDEVHRLLDGIEAYDEAMRASGHYGPKVPVPDDADEQTRLLGFIGRQP